MRKAVVDVGSNSVLLLVEEYDGDRWRLVHESSRVTGLGVGTKETGNLSEGGIDRTLAYLRECFAKANQLGVAETLAAVTMAARIAKNTHEFLHRALAQGTPVFILSGDDEAELGFRAVADDLSFLRNRRISIVDPGGHSTELVTAERAGSAWQTKFRRSYPIGTLALRGNALASESNGPREILSASAAIDDEIGLGYLPGGAGTVIVLGATGTNLVSIRERFDTWQPAKIHGSWLDYEEISKSVGWMMPMTDSDRSQIVGMEPGREKTLHIGALILERFLHALKVLGCYVSVRGWRHALLEQGLPEHTRS